MSTCQNLEGHNHEGGVSETKVNQYLDLQTYAEHNDRYVGDLRFINKYKLSYHFLTKCYRVLMACCIVLLHKVPAIALQILVFVHMEFFLYGYEHQPFKSKEMNRLETLNNILTFYVIYVMMLFTNDGYPDKIHEYNGWVQLGFVLFNIIVHLSVAIYRVFFKIYYDCKKKRNVAKIRSEENKKLDKHMVNSVAFTLIDPDRSFYLYKWVEFQRTKLSIEDWKDEVSWMRS